MRYASSTSVPVEKSKAEIEKILIRYGAGKFASGWNESGAHIGFSMADRYIRFVLPLPSKNDPSFSKTRTGREFRSNKSARVLKIWEQACRQRWRALALVIKAKLEAVEAGITTFEEEFMAHIVLPGGATVAEMAIPKIVEAYKTQKVPQLLPGY